MRTRALGKMIDRSKTRVQKGPKSEHSDEKDSETVSSQGCEFNVIGAKVSAALTSHAALMGECARLNSDC